MRRRSLLATAGTVLLTGCSQIVPPPQETVTDTAASSPGDETTAPTPSPTDAMETDRLTEPEPTTDEATETTTDEATETPSAAERQADEALTTAREHLSRAVDAYVGLADADDATLLNVTAATKVSRSDVVSPADAARSALDDVPEGATASQRRTAEQLRVVASFLVEAIRCQSELWPAYDEIQFVVGRLYAEQFPTVDSSVGEIHDQCDDAREYLDTIHEETDADSTAAFDGIDADTYDRKVAQFEREIDGFDTVADAVATMRDGLEAFGDGVTEYDRDNYRLAREPFRTAADECGAANETLVGMETPTAVTETVSELASVSDAIAAGSADLETAAAEAVELNWDERDAAYESASEHLRSSTVAVDRIDSVQEALEL